MFVCTLRSNRRRFLLDLITTIPLDAIVLAATGANHESNYGRYLGLLGWLKIGRMYRVAVMFQHMSYNLNFGLLALTITRNLTVCVSAIDVALSNDSRGAHFCKFAFAGRLNNTAARVSVMAYDDAVGK